MSASRIRFGISTYNYAPDQMIALAKTAEELGFDNFWMGEHYVIPGARDSVHPGLNDAVKHDETAIISQSVRIDDPWFMLGAVAGVTNRMKLGTAIVIAPLMHPLLLARASATAHDVTGGRFLLGLGAGWMREEFDAIGIPFEERGTRLDEAIEILGKAWNGGFFRHQGKHFQFDELQITPHATPVPLVCGGNSGPALRRVVRIADHWMNSAMIEIEDALKLRDEIEAGRKAIGKTSPLTYFIRPPTPEPQEVEKFVREGFENIVVYGPMVWPQSNEMSIDEKIANLTRIAKEIGVTPA